MKETREYLRCYCSQKMEWNNTLNSKLGELLPAPAILHPALPQKYLKDKTTFLSLMVSTPWPLPSLHNPSRQTSNYHRAPPTTAPRTPTHHAHQHESIKLNFKKEKRNKKMQKEEECVLLGYLIFLYIYMIHLNLSNLPVKFFFLI